MGHCPCPKKDSGELAYHCQMFDCKMFPHFCEKVLTNKRWKCHYMRGKGPTQQLHLPRKEHVVPQNLPPMNERVKSFIHSFIVFGRDGFRTTTKEEHAKRMAICEACSRFLPNIGRCSKCGCSCRKKAVARVWTCPLDKWPILSTEVAKSH